MWVLFVKFNLEIEKRWSREADGQQILFWDRLLTGIAVVVLSAQSHTAVVLWYLALKWQVSPMCRADTSLLLFEKDSGIRISPLWGHFRWLGIFFGCWQHFCFSYGHSWQMSRGLEAMWSKPHARGCSRASVKAVRSPCPGEFYCSLLCSNLSVLKI